GQQSLNHFDGRDHVLGYAFHDVVPVKIQEVAARRTAIIVDEYVGLRSRIDQCSLDSRIGNIAGNFDDLDRKTRADIGGGFAQHVGAATVDDEVAAGLRQRQSTAAAEPLAR